ncbi:hypothetical protein [Streptomyces sp. 6N223]|uniref:hypothetical protein n=1 Tax=Streptomyces sp. 6N223 TaxID=3457412 RepID=UPI003FD5C8D9
MSGGISAEEGEGDGQPAPRGRHAAKRKPLLQRLHMPVGKAVALAAMPSAVLLGTGFTSPLAKADQQPDNPFRGDSCVEMPDPAQAEEEREQTEREQQQQQDQQQQQQEQPERESEAEESAESAEPDRAQESESEGSGQTPAPEETPRPEAQESEQESGQSEPEPEPEASAEDEATADGTDGSGGLLDGVTEGLEDIGEGLGDLLTPGDGGETTEPEQPGETEEPAQPAQPSPEDEAQDEQGAGGTQGGEQDNAAQESGDQQEQPEQPEQEEQEQQEQPDPEASASPQLPPVGEDGAQPFPCPEEKQVPGVDEETDLVLPNEPWYLEASSLTLYGLDYHGVVNVTTANGTTKQVLKFTAEEIDIGDLHQIVDGQGGVRRHVATQPGSVSTFRNGTVTLYTERLQGNLFGLIPITFDPEHEPPLDLPIANFTDVFVIQAGQFGGELTMTGMDSYISNDGPTPTDR